MTNRHSKKSQAKYIQNEYLDYPRNDIKYSIRCQNIFMWMKDETIYKYTRTYNNKKINFYITSWLNKFIISVKIKL